MLSAGFGATVEAGEIAIGSEVGSPVAVVGNAPVLTVPVGSWMISEVGNQDDESVMTPVAIILVTSDLDADVVCVDTWGVLVVGVGVWVVLSLVVTGSEVVDTGIEVVETGSLLLLGIRVEVVTGGKVVVIGSVLLVLAGIPDVGTRVGVVDVTGGIVTVVFAETGGIEEVVVTVGGSVIGTLTVSEVELGSVPFPIGVGVGVTDGVVTGGVADSVPLFVGKGISEVRIPPSLDDKLVGVAEGPVVLLVNGGSKLVKSMPPDSEAELELGDVLDVVGSVDSVSFEVSVGDVDSVSFEVSVGEADEVPFVGTDEADEEGPGNKLVIAPMRPPELDVDVGVVVVVTAPVGKITMPDDDESVGFWVLDVAVVSSELVGFSVLVVAEVSSESVAEAVFVALPIDEVDESE